LVAFNRELVILKSGT